MLKRPNIALLSYNRNKYSETFIQNQVKHLNGNVYYLFGGELSQFYGNESKFLKTDFVSTAVSFFKQKLLQTDTRQQHLNAIEKYFLKHKIEIVLANYAITAFPVMDICERNKIPLIVHFHGWTAYRKSIIDTYKTEYPKLFDIASVIVAVSNDMKLQLEKLGAPAEKIFVLRCGADENLFHFTDHSNNDPVFFSPGRFCETKNPRLSIEAFSLALEKLPDAKLIMAGADEGELQSCLELVERLGIGNKVEFRGVLTHKQISETMKQSAALVLHSSTTLEGEKEGTPVTVLEAALSGLPVVATRHAGIAEIFTHEKSALLSEEFEIKKMAENMVQVISNKGLSQNIANEAHLLVSQNYTLKQYIKSLNNLVAQALMDPK